MDKWTLYRAGIIAAMTGAGALTGYLVDRQEWPGVVQWVAVTVIIVVVIETGTCLMRWTLRQEDGVSRGSGE